MRKNRKVQANPNSRWHFSASSCEKWATDLERAVHKELIFSKDYLQGMSTWRHNAIYQNPVGSGSRQAGGLEDGWMLAMGSGGRGRKRGAGR